MEVEVIERAIGMFTLSEKTAKQAILDIDKLYAIALNQWRFHNGYVIKYEGQVTTAQSAYDSATAAREAAVKAYREHWSSCDYCNIFYLCYDGRMYRQDIDTAYNNQQKAKKALDAAQSLLDYAQGLADKESEKMDIYDNARVPLYTEAAPLLAAEENLREQIATAVTNLANKVTELQKENEEKDAEQDEAIKLLNDAIKELQER